jgi:hypothetical protein
MMKEAIPLHFINEHIEVLFDKPPVLEKKPGCPDGFIWREMTFHVVELLGEWHDYRRRGRMARNMRPTHAEAASRQGSWGVGQDYYRVFTDSGQIFDVYYDRAPRNVNSRKGDWYLYQELTLTE